MILIACLALSVSLSAQTKRMIDRAQGNTDYVAKSMELNDEDRQFLYTALLNSYKDAADRKKGLSDEEKKAVNKEIRKELKAELSKQFSEDEVKEIFALIKEKREKDKESSGN